MGRLIRANPNLEYPVSARRGVFTILELVAMLDTYRLEELHAQGVAHLQGIAIGGNVMYVVWDALDRKLPPNPAATNVIQRYYEFIPGSNGWILGDVLICSRQEAGYVD